MQMKTLVTCAATAVGLAAATPALAVTNFFTDFDSYLVPLGGYVIVPSVEGWTATAGDGIELQNFAAGTPFSSPNLVELDSNNNSAMSRLIDAGKYTLTGYVSPRPGSVASTSGLELVIGSDVYGPEYFDGAGLPDTSWLPFSLSFVVTAPTLLTFRAVGTNDSFGAYLDSIGLVGSPVPEPATWGLMIVGFGVVGAAIRRRARLRVSYS